jgi:hypothetical protein
MLEFDVQMKSFERLISLDELEMVSSRVSESRWNGPECHPRSADRAAILKNAEHDHSQQDQRRRIDRQRRSR